jgi:hypothetical protein
VLSAHLTLDIDTTSPCWSHNHITTKSQTRNINVTFSLTQLTITYLLTRHGRRRKRGIFGLVFLQLKRFASGWLDTAATFRSTLNEKISADAFRQVVVMERQRCHALVTEALIGLIATDLRLHKAKFTNETRQLAALILRFVRRHSATQAVGANGQTATTAEAETISTRLAAADEIFKITCRVAANAPLVHTMAGTILVGTHLLRWLFDNAGKAME